MSSLNAMRGLEPGAPSPESQPLGPPIRPSQGTAIPLSKPTETPGIWERPDGKLETRLPIPPARQAIAPDPVRFAEIGKVYPLEEVQDQRILPCPGVRFMPVGLGTRLVIAQWARQPQQAAPERKVKVGDWVRILSGQPDHPVNDLIGEVVQVTEVKPYGINAGGWGFNFPGKATDSGELMTEFASTPLRGKRADVRIFDDLQDDMRGSPL